MVHLVGDIIINSLDLTESLDKIIVIGDTSSCQLLPFAWLFIFDICFLWPKLKVSKLNVYSFTYDPYTVYC